MTATGTPAASDLPLAGHTARIVVNLSALLALGVLISGWVLFYTDWFPIVGGLLGLGGLLAWAAFLSGLLTPERKAELQAAFEHAVLDSRTTWKVVAALALFFVVCASLVGSVVLDTYGDDRGRLLLGISSMDSRVKPRDDREYLMPHAEQKFVVFTGWRGRSYSVKISGFPTALPRISSLHRTRLTVPKSFGIRPVLLIRLSPSLSADGAAGLFRLTVKRNGSEIGALAHERYRGQSVWVGCDIDVAIPDRLIADWRLELDRHLKNRSSTQPGWEEEVLSRWTAPVALADAVVPNPGDDIEATLIAGDGHVVLSHKVSVHSASEGPANIQEIYLRFPEPAVKPSPPVNDTASMQEPNKK
jgi:hypothetical protein